jgi:hypothetical protein
MEAGFQKISNLQEASQGQVRDVLAAYNGGCEAYKSSDARRYGTETRQYCDAFSRYNAK